MTQRHRAKPQTPPATGTTVREATLELLRAFDMTTVFGNPGSTELKFFRDWPTDFRYVLGLEESICVATADGYAQATRNAAFVNLHSAAGVGHALGSVFTAYRNQTPLVITAGQQTRAMFPTDPYLYASEAAEFPKPYVKWSVEPARAQDVPAAIARGYHIAMQKPCGPVFVSIPEDDWDAPAEPVEARCVVRGIAPDPVALRELADALDASRRPALVVGAAVDQDGAWQQAIALAEKLEAPVWASPMSGRCSFPEDHRLFAGFLPPLRQPLANALAGHDLVLVMGAPVFTYHVHTGGSYLPEGARLWQLTDDPVFAARAPVGTGIVCTLRLGIAQLLDLLPVRPRASGEGRGPRPVPRAGDPPSGDYAMHAIAKLMPDDAIVVEEAPTQRGALHEYLPIRTSSGFYAGASGGLGWALPAALGVALAEKQRKVICVVGDGSSLYAIQALWSAAREKLPVVFVVLNNSGYSALKSFGGMLGIDGAPGHNVPGVDFVSIARGFGCDARKAATSAELDEALSVAFSASKPMLVEVILDTAVKRLY
ncbi:MAG TPA: benzoylformate decarboxylase [Burkholderiales bacterium]|nr:benzoylformate decarboxylase [Burkholderiales bacterium]